MMNITFTIIQAKFIEQHHSSAPTFSVQGGRLHVQGVIRVEVLVALGIWRY